MDSYESILHDALGLLDTWDRDDWARNSDNPEFVPDPAYVALLARRKFLDDQKEGKHVSFEANTLTTEKPDGGI
jgi:hypothetical protein